MADNDLSMNITPENAAASASSVNSSKRSWGGSAFILESLLLVVFFIASFAIILQLLSTSYAKGEQAEEMTNAVMLASNDAELFSQEPYAPVEPKHYILNKSGEISEGASYDSSIVYTVKRDVTSEKTTAGTLFNARITVDYGSKEVYSLNTAKYVSSEDLEAMQSDATGSTSASASTVVSGIAI